jgi:hypothetical protein
LHILDNIPKPDDNTKKAEGKGRKGAKGKQKSSLNDGDVADD